MQVRVMAACMESQADILECTASTQSGRREVTVCFSPMSMFCTHVTQEVKDDSSAKPPVGRSSSSEWCRNSYPNDN